MKTCHRCGQQQDEEKSCLHCGDAASRAPIPSTSETLLSALESEESRDDPEFEDESSDLPPSGTGHAPFLPIPPRAHAPRVAVPALTREEALSRWEAVLDNSPVFADPTKPRPASPPVEPPFLVPFDFETQDIITTTPIGEAVNGDSPAALDVAIDARFDVASAPAEADPAVDLLVTITPLGPPLLDRRAGPVTHVVLALDLSASMNAPDKYPLLTRALSGMLNDLRKFDAAPVLLSVVVFAYGAEVLFRAVPASELPVRRLLDALDKCPLRFGRYTDVVGALSRAGRIAHDSVKSRKAMPVRVYLMTDGRPQDVAGARAVMEKIHKMPVDVDGLAFGDDADVACLKSLIAGGRGGTVKHVRPDTIEEAFGRIGDVAQRVVAPRALFELELRGGAVGGMAYRFRPARHRYGDDAFEQGRTFSRDLGTLESGRTYSLLFQVRLPMASAGETEVGRVLLRVPGYGGPRSFEKIVWIPRHCGPPDLKKDPEVVAARDVLDALDNDDPAATLRALRTRRQIYEREHRDPHILQVVDRAIAEVERHGSLVALSQADQAALVSHTLTKRGVKKSANARREHAAS